MDELAKPRPRILFLRGVDFSDPVGASDWRIALYMPDFGFETAVLGRGQLPGPPHKGVELISVPVCRLPALNTLTLSCLYAAATLKRRPDIALVNPGVALAGAWCKALNPRLKLVLDIRTIPVELDAGLGRMQSAWFERILRSSFFDACSVVSEGMLDRLDSQYSLKARMPTIAWGSGYDEEIFGLAVDGNKIRQEQGLEGRFVLMFHGSLSPARGLGEVVRSLRLLLDRGEPDFHLVLIGRGAAERNLLELARALQVEEYVHCIPPVAHAAIPGWIAAADLGLDPLPDHPWWREQSPLKVYEYLAMGRPVLATDLPCHRHISEAVILVPDNRPATLAEAILRVKRLPPGERQRLSQAALRDAQQHTWRARAAVLASFLHEHFPQA
ncbi:MAG: glycosyltransferase family 4 protein [Anaerolineae bacterium]|nr:glycosyltransferase family 4 protein [Anaerolineae bacterium]